MRTRRLEWLLLLVLVATPASAKEPVWLQVKSPHFIVYSDAGEKQARRVAQQFELIRAILGRKWPWARLDPGQPVWIFAVRDEASLKVLLPSYWEQKNRFRPAGVFARGAHKHFVALRTDLDNAADDPNAYYTNPYHLIFHEYVHLVLDQNFGSMPLWFNEGLAEYFGATWLSGHLTGLGRAIPGHVWELRDRRPLPIDVLLSVDESSPHYNEQSKAGIFYAQSWALIHYLVYGDGGRHTAGLNRYASLLKEGVDPAEAARQALPPASELGRALDAYIRKRAFYYAKGPAPVPDAKEGYFRASLSQRPSR